MFKVIAVSLLFSTVSMAGGIHTSLSESYDGFSFSLFEKAYPGERAPLWNFAQSLNKKDMMTSDKNFSFRCKQSQNAKSVLETRCSGVLKDASTNTAQGNIGNDFVTITLTGKTAAEFYSVLPSKNENVSLNLQDKLVIMGNKINLGILVSH